MAQLNGHSFSFDSLGLQGPQDGQLEDGQNYIVIQLHDTLNRAQKQRLQSHGVVIQKHLGNNAWKCRYEPSDIGRIISEDFVKDAVPEPPQLKVQPSLDTDANHVQTVDVVLQDRADRSAEEVSTLIQGITGVAPDNMSTRRDNTVIRVEVPLNRLAEIAAIDSVASIEKVVDLGLHNNVARGILNANNVTVKDTATPFKGAGQIVTVADTGFDKGSTTDAHAAFSGRVVGLLPIGRPKDTNDIDGHGTHVCGSVLGNGTSDKMGGVIQGIAPEAQLIVQALGTANKGLFGRSTVTLAGLLQSAYERKSRIHTNSWGPKWRDSKTGVVFGQQPYNNASTDLDTAVWAHRDLAVCFSAGNDGHETPLPGNRGHVGAQAAAKNCITVGSCPNQRPTADGTAAVVFDAKGTQQGNPAAISFFSSRGPTIEGRIKPDVVAPGGMILSAKSRDAVVETRFGVSEDPAWWWCSGTSMSTPLVAGCVAVLRHVLVGAGVTDPSAALLKALLVNGATDLGRPRSEQGFGRVDLAASVVVKGKTAGKDFVEGQLLEEHGKDVFSTKFALGKYLPAGQAAGTLKATMVYTDMPGEALQHQVSLVVEVLDDKGAKTVRYGNAGDGAEQKKDMINTVEQVVWKNIPRAYEVTLTVELDGVIIHDHASQPFALVWSVL
ncbi:peptidase S8/S53 domain-containing protein [Lasiosphaeria miniovina]|uniref:Peptidase S8/S53 domain-containing protein n=1 Tax=Lasiosphaeria miniovina TaxID=1954250 RepID=A0AA40DS25_9PEZI|nr:peptidase S8/S53 domain-containing protein [Lasiosphaeria miniovina]KAK0709893.1 peptidase S8/S53 domain-containing protein [Lasiosphaeria miniovina]